MLRFFVEGICSSIMSLKSRGYIFALVAIVIFAMQDGISKHLGGAYPPIFITMLRFWAFAVFAVVLASRTSGSLRKAAATKRPFLQVSRGILLAVQIVIAITSFAVVGLAYTQAIFASGPLIVALLSMPLLGERVGWRRWTAICAGLVGVLIILAPQDGIPRLTVLIPLVAAVIFALYVITTRMASRDDPAMTSFFYTGVGGAAVMTLIGPFFWTWMSPGDWLWMLLLCMTGISSHYFLIRAYDILDAAAAQPLMYLQLVFASIMGTTVFGETLTINMIAGSIVVVAAGIFTVWRESVVARRAAAKANSQA